MLFKHCKDSDFIHKILEYVHSYIINLSASMARLFFNKCSSFCALQKHCISVCVSTVNYLLVIQCSVSDCKILFSPWVLIRVINYHYLNHHWYKHHLLVLWLSYRTSRPQVWEDPYVMPWMRCPAYLIGLVLGYVLFKTNRKIYISWVIVH